MAMTKSTVVFLVLVAVSSLSVVPSASDHDRHSGRCCESIDDACKVTLHRSLCIRTLTPFSNPAAQMSIQSWTKAAVSATLAETARNLHYVDELRSDGTLVKGHRARDALSVCAECLGDAGRKLRQSVAELRRLNRSSDFGPSMNNIETWVSAALTDQDACVDGLAGWKSQLVGTISRRIVKTTYYSSNALALLNKLASDGGD